MARIFTVDFDFRGRRHEAMVATWKGEPASDFFQIALQGDALQHLVPDGIVRFSAEDSDKTNEGTGRDELVQCLKKAVMRYLQSVSVQNSLANL